MDRGRGRSHTEASGSSDAFVRPFSERKPLRVGVMLDSATVEAWIHKVLTDIRESDFADIVLVLLNSGAHSSAASTTGDQALLQPKALSGICGNWMFEQYVARDYRRNRVRDDALAIFDARGPLDGAAILDVTPPHQSGVDGFSKDVLVATGAADLDVLLRFGFPILRGELRHSARYGIWSCHHGGNRPYRGSPDLFWEMYEKNPVSDTTLQILTERLDGRRVIYRSRGATHPWSLYRNRNAACWKTSEFIPRCLSDLYQHGWQYMESLDTINEDPTNSRGLCPTPTLLPMTRFLGRLGFAYAKHSLLPMTKVRWSIGIRRRKGPDSPLGEAGADYLMLHCPPDRSYADPTVIRRDGRSYVFFEDYRHDISKGMISAASVSRDGSFGEPKVVLERDYHLSYPFVFEWRGDVFMIPDSGDVRRVELYRAYAFPEEWRLERVLIDNVNARDATVVARDGKLWMFTSVSVPGGPASDEVSLYFADSLFGPWFPHPRNPLVSDASRARPAGGLFLRRGDLIRPAQDCIPAYGSAITLNRVDVMTEDEYAEVQVGRIEPTWRSGLIGVHTINFDDDYEVIDGKYLLRRGPVARASHPLRSANNWRRSIGT